MLTSWKLELFLLRQSLKTQEKLKELDILYQNAIYACISWYSKICWFPVKNCWCQRNSRGVSRDSNNCVKFHHCRIRVTDFKEEVSFWYPHPWAAPKKPILTRVNLYLFCCGVICSFASQLKFYFTLTKLLKRTKLVLIWRVWKKLYIFQHIFS